MSSPLVLFIPRYTLPNDPIPINAPRIHRVGPPPTASNSPSSYSSSESSSSSSSPLSDPCASTTASSADSKAGRKVSSFDSIGRNVSPPSTTDHSFPSSSSSSSLSSSAKLSTI